MTIEGHIKNSRLENKGKNTDWKYVFSKHELHDLLEQVAKEQREICAREFTDEAAPMVRGHYRILNAPSPSDI